MLFENGDKNLDGNLSKDEIKAMDQYLHMWSNRVADSESELNSTISSLDTNNDGLI